MDLGISGLASGFDWRNLIDQLMEVERAPQTRLRADQQSIGKRNSAYASLAAELSTLKSRLEVLTAPGFFSTRTARSSAEAVAKATAGTAAAPGQYVLNITQLAAAAKQLGTTNIGTRLSSSSNVSGVIIGQAPFSTPVIAGTFTVNGKSVSVAATDSLQTVFTKISQATGGQVTASYSASTDRITLSSASAIVLGSATDTSNFLQAARLANNGTGTVTSSASLGTVKVNAALNAGNFTTAISDGGAGLGEFKINGVSIQFNASTDSLSNVIDRINASTAGVTASFDPNTDRLTLTNKITGDMGFGLQDVTGNFLAGTGLLGGSLQRGKNLLYTVNGGSQLTSASNTITEQSSGLPGLSVSVLTTGSATITVESDQAALKKGITDFLDQYNKVQGLIDTQTASTTDANGKVTAGVLADDGDADSVASRLRSMVNASSPDLAAVIKRLDDLGITSGGYDNNLTLSDSAKLDGALANNLKGVEALFTASASGVAVGLVNFLERTVGEGGTLVAKQDLLTKQSKDIDVQIAEMERRLENQRQGMIERFMAMETAQAKINQQLQFLMQKFGTGSTAST